MGNGTNYKPELDKTNTNTQNKPAAVNSISRHPSRPPCYEQLPNTPSPDQLGNSSEELSSSSSSVCKEYELINLDSNSEFKEETTWVTKCNQVARKCNPLRISRINGDNCPRHPSFIYQPGKKREGQLVTFHFDTGSAVNIIPNKLATQINADFKKLINWSLQAATICQ